MIFLRSEYLSWVSTIVEKQTKSAQSVVLTKKQLEKGLGKRNLVIEPFLDLDQLSEVGVDFHLDNQFAEFRRTAGPCRRPKLHRRCMAENSVRPRFDDQQCAVAQQ